jgi:glycosyltransferase involved in cell wall biosynthesis
MVGDGASGRLNLNQPKKILYTIPNFITAGSGGALVNIIQRLDQEQFAPAVCVSKLGGKLDDTIRNMGILLIEAPFTVPAKPYRSLYGRARAASQVFKPYGFDLWHSFHYSDDYSESIIARLSGAKAWVYTKKNMNWHQNAWYLRSLLASGIAAQNTDMVKDFFSRWPLRSKVKLIPRGVDTIEFFPGSQSEHHWRNEIGIADSKILIGCAAHLVPVKGHTTLLQAARTCENIHILMAGNTVDNDYYAQLRNLVSELGIGDRVHFLGQVADMPKFFAGIDIAVLPTWNRWRKEGSPVALLEAMACGKACIATDVPGSRDLIENGISGLLVPPEDSERPLVSPSSRHPFPTLCRTDSPPDRRRHRPSRTPFQRIRGSPCSDRSL